MVIRSVLEGAGNDALQSILGALLPAEHSFDVYTNHLYEVLGTVTDSTGAVIPKSKVTPLRGATGERRTTTTTSSATIRSH